MADKPAQLCQLKKGVFVDDQVGFVDTFNWAVNAIANLEGGEKCDVTWPLPDHPQIDVDVEKESGGGGGGAGIIQGTDGSQAVPDENGVFVFASAADTNLTVTCSGNTVTFGVYYV